MVVRYDSIECFCLGISPCFPFRYRQQTGWCPTQFRMPFCPYCFRSRSECLRIRSNGYFRPFIVKYRSRCLLGSQTQSSICLYACDIQWAKPYMRPQVHSVAALCGKDLANLSGVGGSPGDVRVNRMSWSVRAGHLEPGHTATPNGLGLDQEEAPPRGGAYKTEDGQARIRR